MAMTIHRTRAHHSVARGPITRRWSTPVGPATRGRSARRRSWASAIVAGGLSVAGLGVHGVLSGPGDVPASAAGAGPASVVRTIKAHPGDSLWSIAARHRGDVSIRRYVDALVELNGGSTRIEAGQLVRLP